MERRIFLAGLGVGVALALCVAALALTQRASTAAPTAERVVESFIDEPIEDVRAEEPSERSSERTVIHTEAPSTTATTEELLALALMAAPNQVALAEEAGVQVVPTSDGHSFYLLWLPEDFDPSTDTLIVDLHGSDAFAYDSIAAWHKEAEERGYGVLALQWWFGTGDAAEDYYTPKQIYALLSPIMDELGLTPGNAVLHGFSRGSASTYGVMYYDADQSEPFFGAAIANAGPMSMDYSMYADFMRGRYGRTPLKNTRWILYCGEYDGTNGDTCAQTETTSRYLVRFGGVVDLFMRDANGEYGGFQTSITNTNVVLNVVNDILAED